MPDDNQTPPRDWKTLLIERLAGLVVAVLAVVMYALGMPDELWILVLLGGLALIGVSVPMRRERGFARVAALVPIVAAGVGSLVLLALVTMLGCASLGAQVDGDTMLIKVRRAPDGSCTYQHTVDETVLDHGELETCPLVPVCEERPVRVEVP